MGRQPNQIDEDRQRQDAGEFGHRVEPYGSADGISYIVSGAFDRRRKACQSIRHDSSRGYAALAAMAFSVGIKRRADQDIVCLLYTSPSPRDRQKSRMPSSA